jgi:membrane-bound inhibitor of C-type lysozyme
MRLYSIALLLPFAALAASPAFAASPTAAPAPEATAPASAPVAPAAVPPTAPTATSALTITLGTTGDFERKTVKYGCKGDVEALSVDYINAPPNYLALVTLDGATLLFNTVLSGSGAKYAAGKYVWWTKGSDASLYDQTQGANAKPVLTCAEVNETP